MPACVQVCVLLHLLCVSGVNPHRLLEGFTWPEFRWRRGELLSQFEGKTVLVGVDDMDVFKGIELKLQAFDRVLEEHPEWRGELVLVQVRGDGGWQQGFHVHVVHCNIGKGVLIG